METSRGYLACGLWVLATSLMLYGTLDYERDDSLLALSWGLFAGLGACVFTGWLIVDCRRNDVTVEQIVEVVDALHEARHDLPSLPNSPRR